MARHLNLKEYATDPRTHKRYCVSTVKLSIDHGWNGTPLWYETMVFPASPDKDEISDWGERYCDRYTYQDSAETGHAQTVKSLIAGELALSSYDSDTDE